MELLKVDEVFCNRYRIERFLAKGGMGAVFVGEHIATEARVAIKVLWPHVLDSTDAIQKFEVEAKVAARVKSDHIVKVLDAGYDDQSRLPFLVMELLDGQSLQERVDLGGPLCPREAASMTLQVASGLDKAHGYVDRNGMPSPIVHRDLKPENIFLTTREDGQPLIKILDFGIAKVLSQSAAASREVKGTPLYMAYEQAAGEPVTPRTDVWSLGLIAYYLMTGTCYWKAGGDPDASLTSLFAEVLSLPLDPPSVRAYQQGVAFPWPAAFDEWFGRCVSRQPGNRYPTAGDAARGLAHALGCPDLAVRATPTPPAELRVVGTMLAGAQGSGAGDASPASTGRSDTRTDRIGVSMTRRPGGRGSRMKGAVIASTAILGVSAILVAALVASRVPTRAAASAAAGDSIALPGAGGSQGLPSSALDCGVGAAPSGGAAMVPAQASPAKSIIRRSGGEAEVRSPETADKDTVPPVKKSQPGSKREDVYEGR